MTAVPKVMVFLLCESWSPPQGPSWLASGGGEEGGGGGCWRAMTRGDIPAAHQVPLSPTAAAYQGFSKATAGVLLCTDVGAGLDFVGVGATVQWIPSDPTTYAQGPEPPGLSRRLGGVVSSTREVEHATVLGDSANFCARRCPRAATDGAAGAGRRRGLSVSLTSSHA